MDRSDDGIFMYKQVDELKFVQLFANKKLKKLVNFESDESKIDLAYINMPYLQHQSDDNTSLVTLNHIMENETLYVKKQKMRVHAVDSTVVTECLVNLEIFENGEHSFRILKFVDLTFLNELEAVSK